jgi:AcrR family transcriptional regulator
MEVTVPVVSRAAVSIADTVRARLREVPRPTRLLAADREAALTPRQREVLDRLGAILDEEGFAGATMAGLAERARCSLRTLYTLAATRDDLVLTVVDRALWAAGRAAWTALAAETSPLAALRAYLHTTTAVITDWSAAFARDITAMPRAQELRAAHDAYLVAVIRTLLDLAVAAREIRAVDTVAVARVLAELGRTFTRPDVLPTLAGNPRDAADLLVDVVLAGLRP